jgi:hypothetical protein
MKGGYMPKKLGQGLREEVVKAVKEHPDLTCEETMLFAVSAASVCRWAKEGWSRPLF